MSFFCLDSKSTFRFYWYTWDLRYEQYNNDKKSLPTLLSELSELPRQRSVLLLLALSAVSVHLFHYEGYTWYPVCYICYISFTQTALVYIVRQSCQRSSTNALPRRCPMLRYYCSFSWLSVSPVNRWLPHISAAFEHHVSWVKSSYKWKRLMARLR